VDVANRYVEPTIVLDPPPDSALMRRRSSAGAAGDQRGRDAPRHQARRRSRQAAGLYLFTKSKVLEEAVLERLSAGSVCINDAVIFMVSPELPFGASATAAWPIHRLVRFRDLSHLKPVMKRSFRFDAPMRYPPIPRRRRSC